MLQLELCKLIVRWVDKKNCRDKVLVSESYKLQSSESKKLFSAGKNVSYLLIKPHQRWLELKKWNYFPFSWNSWMAEKPLLYLVGILGKLTSSVSPVWATFKSEGIASVFSCFGAGFKGNCGKFEA